MAYISRAPRVLTDQQAAVHHEERRGRLPSRPATARLGLGCIVTLHHRSSTSHWSHIKNSVYLFLKRQCDRTLGTAGRGAVVSDSGERGSSEGPPGSAARHATSALEQGAEQGAGKLLCSLTLCIMGTSFSKSSNVSIILHHLSSLA